MSSAAGPVILTPLPDGMRIAFVKPFHMDTTEIEDELQSVLAARPKLIEVDLSALGHLSTIGLGLLMSLNHRIQGQGGKLRIVKLRKNTLGVLKVTKLDHMLTIDSQAVVD